MWCLNLVVALALFAMSCDNSTAQKSVPASRPASSSNNPEELRRLADKGDVDAMFNLGWMYANGRGVPQDGKQAVEWYRKAADLGDAKAMFNLGVMYANGSGEAKDEKQAVEWYRKAACRCGRLRPPCGTASRT
ncbi:MAG: tetratricopeptide repeat protein [Planctomycetota bacterium]|nr:tetratricopeptide repeat protein [Planctomycetota bacterium]